MSDSLNNALHARGGSRLHMFLSCLFGEATPHPMLTKGLFAVCHVARVPLSLQLTLRAHIPRPPRVPADHRRLESHSLECRLLVALQSTHAALSLPVPTTQRRPSRSGTQHTRSRWGHTRLGTMATRSHGAHSHPRQELLEDSPVTSRSHATAAGRWRRHLRREPRAVAVAARRFFATIAVCRRQEATGAAS